MKSLLLLPLVAAALVFAVPAEAAGERMAVVDMIELISEHPVAKDLQRKLEQRESEAEAYAMQEQQALRNLQREIELMTRNDPNRMMKEKELLTQQTMLKFEIEWRKEQALREYMKGLETLYANIHGLVANYARGQGFAVVLLKTSPQITAMDFNDYGAKIRLRAVVYNDPAMDITPQIRAMFGPSAPPANTPGRAPAPPRGR